MNRNDNIYFSSLPKMRNVTRSLGIVLRWVTVIMLMITPLRTVVADGGHCHMANMSSMGNMAAHKTGVHMSSVRMSRSGSLVQSSAQPDSTFAKTMNDMSVHKCCEEGGSGHCQCHCGMNIHVSMFIQSISFMQTSFTASLSEATIYSPVFRQQTPLLRPPSSLNS